MNLKNIDFLNILEWASVLLVAGMMSVYGLGKYVQFNTALKSDFKAMKIMWDFYGYSRPFAIIIGLFEILGAAMILLPKTRIVGCLLLTCILINVILQDYFFDVPAFSTAIILQILIFFILWLNRTALILGLKKFMSVDKNIRANRLPQIVLIILTTIILFTIFQSLKTLF